MADVNGDGYLDIYVCKDAFGNPDQRNNLLYINNGDLTFTESAKKFGLIDESYSTQAYFFDYDLDNDLDLYLVNHPGDIEQSSISRIRNLKSRGKDENLRMIDSDRMYKNDNGCFIDVTKKARVLNQAFGLSATISDFNKDGYPDVFVANDFFKPDQIMINTQNESFEDKADHYLKHMTNSSMGSDIADLNNDGYMDLVVTDMQPNTNFRKKTLASPMVYNSISFLESNGYKKQIMRNMLHLGSKGSFQEVGQLAGIAETDWSWSVLLGDYNLDGMDDIFITNGIRRDMTNMDYIRFKYDSVQKAGKSNKYALNKDTWREWLDLYPSKRISNFMYQNNKNLEFLDVSEIWGLDEFTFSHGAAYADLDNDGDLDLVINNLEDTVSIYRNNADKLLNNNYLKIHLKGPKGNTFGIGSRVTIYHDGGLQTRSMYTQRGFLSSVEPAIFFGLGDRKEVDSVIVNWTDGRFSMLRSTSANQSLTIDYETSELETMNRGNFNKVTPIFNSTDLQDFSHQENDYEDFRADILLPHGITQMGPCVTSTDLNGDKKLDFFVGSSKNHVAYIMMSTEDSYVKEVPEVFIEDKKYEDGGAVFLELANGEIGLFVASGGGQQGDDQKILTDRFYTFSKGGWIKSGTFNEASNSSVVQAADVDMDGDQDLFIGGYFQINNYPFPSSSYFLENVNGTYQVNTSWSQALENEVINDAAFADFNQDGYPDLVTVGEWSPVLVYLNEGGKGFQNRTAAFNLDQSTGWWHSVELTDIDLDGDLDILAGNLGKNSRYKATLNNPIGIYAKDFDQNNDSEYLITFLENGQEWPFARKDVLAKVLTKINKEYQSYQKYATTPADQLLDLKDTYQRSINTTATTLFLNEKNAFKASELPWVAQLAPVFDFEIADLTGDGKPEIIGVGNRYDADVEQGPYDASKGFILSYSEGTFQILPPNASGFSADKHARKVIQLNRSDAFLIVNNNDIMQVIERR